MIKTIIHWFKPKKCVLLRYKGHFWRTYVDTMPQWELDNADEMIEDLKKMDINITKFPNGILFSDENEAMIIMLKWSEYFEVAQ